MLGGERDTAVFRDRQGDDLAPSRHRQHGERSFAFLCEKDDVELLEQASFLTARRGIRATADQDTTSNVAEEDHVRDLAVLESQYMTIVKGLLGEATGVIAGRIRYHGAWDGDDGDGADETTVI